MVLTWHEKHESRAFCALAETRRHMTKAKSEVDNIRKEYRLADLGSGVRGKFHAQYRKGHNLVLLTPEVAEAFPTDEAVNDALLALVRLARTLRRSSRRSSGPAAKRSARRST